MTWQPLANISDAPEDDDDIVPFKVGDLYIALVKMDGQLYATNDVCTHEFALLSDGIAEDGCIECPLHQARFDILTGERRSGPACDNLAVYPVKVEGDTIYVDVP